MILYAFDVDETLEVSNGPMKLLDLVKLRQQGHIVGLCGNWTMVTLHCPDWHQICSFVAMRHRETRLLAPAATVHSGARLRPTARRVKPKRCRSDTWALSREASLGTADTIGSGFDDNGTAPAALMSAPHAAEIVEQTQKRTPAATGPLHGCQPPIRGPLEEASHVR